MKISVFSVFGGSSLVRVSRGASLCNHEKCETVRDRLASTTNKERVGDESEYEHSDRALTAFFTYASFSEAGVLYSH